jgi:ribonuclease P protein component
VLTRAEYQRVFEQGEKQVGRHFVCYLVRREEPGSKLGLVVSRKVGNAVARNRVKRRIREYFRLHQHEFTGAAEVVVVARPGAAALDGAASAESLHKLFKRGGLQDG